MRIQPWLLLLFFTLFFSVSTSLIGSKPATVENPHPTWQVLSKKNFSSQIHLHSHILLIVTNQWSGEARSLMKDIKQDVASINNKNEYSELKLMVVYRNSEKILADMLDKTEGIKIIYYHNSIPLKYKGRLRALNILSSVKYTMSLQQYEIPLMPLNEINEIEGFIESTEKSIFLIDLCDWSNKLMHESNESYEKVIKDAYNSLELLNIKDKIIENEELYGADVSISPWEQLGLTSANQNTSEETINYDNKGLSKCTKEEFEKFKSFYKDFVSIAKDNFLPFEKQRFGLLTNKSFLNYLGVNIDIVQNWAVLVQYSFCPNCSVLARETKEIKSILKDHHPLVKELDQNPEVSFPENRPSLVLFIDTSSENKEIKLKSKLALAIIRKYAWQNRNFISPPIIRKNKDSSESKLVKIKEDVFVINQNNENEETGGNNNNNDNNNIIDILAKLIQQSRVINDKKNKENEKKISVVAKELGFQLLSDDFSVKLIELNNSSLIDVNMDSNEGVKLNTDKDNLSYDNKESENNNEKEVTIENNIKEELYSEKVNDSIYTEEIASESVHSYESDNNNNDDDDNNNNNNNNNNFRGSIYFLNGDYQLLNTLTSKSNIPTLLIIDPITQNHYIYSSENPINNLNLINFINNFLNQSLPPYIKSDPLVRIKKEIPKTPFLNLDFHEADAIPRITADEFCELISGFKNCLINFNENKVGDILGRDILVLFSNSWCGFCNRMEFVLREVYRTLKNFIEEKRETFNLNDFPSIYLMDCIRNDCFPFLNSQKMEIYPSLLLYPAKSKGSILYQGSASVLNIFEFLQTHLNNFKKYRGILWTHVTETNINKPTPMLNDISSIIQEHKINKIDTKLEISSEIPNNNNNNNKSKYKIMVGSTLLATENLSNSSPFNNSTILIISANPKEGFQGLIYNKPMNWNIFKDPNGNIEPIKNAPVFYGGPISHPGFPLVSLSKKNNEGYFEVINGVYFGNGVATNRVINRIKNGDEFVDGFWFFFGYTGWGYEQLFDELDQGAWDLSENVIESLDWPDS